MIADRCPRCDRVECRQPALWAHYNALWENSRGVVTEAMRQVQREFNEADKECHALKVDWRARALAAESRLAALTPDPEALEAAGEVLRLAELREQMEERAGDGDAHAEEGLADLDARLWTLAPRLAAWVAERGSK